MFIPLKKAVKGFWDRHENQVHKWFLNRKRYSVVISASPDFLLDEIQKRLGFDELICTRHNAKTGAIIGKNCRDEEKVNRLFELYNKCSLSNSSFINRSAFPLWLMLFFSSGGSSAVVHPRSGR